METDANMREMVLFRTIAGVLILGAPVALLTVTIVVTYAGPESLAKPAYALMMMMYGTLVPLYLLDMPFRYRASGFTAVLAAMSLASMLVFGVAPAPVLAALLAVLTAGVFVGRRALLVSLIGVGSGIGLVGLALTSGAATPVTSEFLPAGGASWGRVSIEFTLVAGSIAVLIVYLTRVIENQEAALAERNRLATLGRLAGGVAQDVNSVVQVMYAWSHLLRDHEDDEVREAMTAIGEAGERASRLSAHLRTLARQDRPDRQTLGLGQEVTRWVAAMSHLVPDGVVLTTRCDANPQVQIDRVHLEQILLNLVTNARDAVGNSGRIEIQVDTTRADGQDWARIRVVDDGNGISNDHLAHIFEPFFTTHGKRRSGLGLAVVQTAVTRCDGSIAVTRTSPQGTTFEVRLPLALERADPNLSHHGGAPSPAP